MLVYKGRDNKFKGIGRITFNSNRSERSIFEKNRDIVPCFDVKDNLDIIELNDQVSGEEEEKKVMVERIEFIAGPRYNFL